MWRLSRRLRLAPEQFVLAHPQKEPSSDGFLLQADGPVLGLALDKQGRFRDTQPCVFLLELGGGQTRCGVYHDRPVVCQGYPMSLLAGKVRHREDALCPPESWPEPLADLDGWRAALQRLRMTWDIYAEVAARWNARVEASRPGRVFGLSEYLAYLLNVYDRIGRLDGRLGPGALGRVLDQWPGLPRPAWRSSDLPRLRQLAWWEYFELVRTVIDGVYPDLPPLPDMMLSGATPVPATALAAPVPDGGSR